MVAFLSRVQGAHCCKAIKQCSGHHHQWKCKLTAQLTATAKNLAAACTAGYLNQLAATTSNIVSNSSFTYRLSSFHLRHWLLQQKHISSSYSAVRLQQVYNSHIASGLHTTQTTGTNSKQSVRFVAVLLP